MDAELAVNLWAIYDASTGLVYGLSGRAYCVAGTDAEKLAILQRLSATDYVTAKRYRVPARHQVVCGDGTTRRSVTLLNAVSDPTSGLFEEMFKNIESELPPIPDFSTPDGRFVPQKLPPDPLSVVTTLYEDDAGNIHPIITDEDRRWVQQQERACGRGVPGLG